MKRVGKGLLITIMLVGLTPFVWRQSLKWAYGSAMHTVESAPHRQVAVVFGAAIYGNGRLSSVLRDRMDTAVSLYHAGKVDKLLVSGDNRFENYNEPGAMMAYAISQGVPEADIQPDYGGRRTYDTCYRAKEVFQAESAILVTQAFHLPRAIFTCRRLGVAAEGVVADKRPYRNANWYAVRETAASLNALWDVIRHQPPPVLGEPIPLIDQQ